MSDAYKKIKKHNGEAFAQTLRNYHNGLLEIEGIDQIVRHAGRDASELLPYLMSLLSSNENQKNEKPQDPFVLLDQAGYDAFYADTPDLQNSIKKYFKEGELLCTFNDAARCKEYHIVHAVKKDVDKIKRADFEGHERRQDAYGTSVISIQMLRNGGFISIKNRYNHTVKGCDNTFNSNPDNIIDGLSISLQRHFKVKFKAKRKDFPEGFALLGDQVLKYHKETNNFYYGDQAWGKDGVIYEVNRAAGDALFDGFLFDNKNKVLKRIDPQDGDKFANDFNDCYGGNRKLNVKDGNLFLDDVMLIGTEQSRIKTLFLPALTKLNYGSLATATALTHFQADALTMMSGHNLERAPALIEFKANALTTMKEYCLHMAGSLKHFEANALTIMEKYCLHDVDGLETFDVNTLKVMEYGCLYQADALVSFNAGALTRMSDTCLQYVGSLKTFRANELIEMGCYNLQYAYDLRSFEANALKEMGSECLYDVRSLIRFTADSLIKMGRNCLYSSGFLIHFQADALEDMGYDCLRKTNIVTKAKLKIKSSIVPYFQKIMNPPRKRENKSAFKP